MPIFKYFAVVGSAGKKLFATSVGGALYLFKSSRNLLEWSASWGIADNSEKIFAPSACWSLRRGQPQAARVASLMDADRGSFFDAD